MTLRWLVCAHCRLDLGLVEIEAGCACPDCGSADDVEWQCPGCGKFTRLYPKAEAPT